MSKDRILYWGKMELPDKNALAHRNIANCCALEQCGYTPVLVGYSKDQVSNDILSTLSKVNGFDTFSLPYPQSITGWLKDESNFKCIERIIKHYGVDTFKAIVFTGLGVGNNHGLLKLSKKYDIPLVRDIVDWFEYDKGNILYRLVKTLETKVVVDYYTPKIHNVICISTYLQKYFETKKCKMLLIPSLTHRGDTRFSNLPAYKRDGMLKIAYVGNPGKRGNKDRIDWCVKAYLNNQSRKCEFHICGITKEAFCADFPEYSSMLDDKNIVFYGKVSNRMCVEIVAMADFFVFAREDKQATRAGFPTKLSEAFAIGTPVITTPSGDVASYLKDDVNGYIAEECSYDSFLIAWEHAMQASDEKIVELHSACKCDSPLYDDKWTKDFYDFFASL